jgi:hypothetical protein
MPHLENHEIDIENQIKMNGIQNSFTIVCLGSWGLPSPLGWMLVCNHNQMKQKPCQIPMKTTNNYNYFYVLQFKNHDNHNKLLPKE